MAANQYPAAPSPAFVSTAPPEGHSTLSNASPMFAIDCEMCRTGPAHAWTSELTCIAVVDENLRCIYQTYVKPPRPITDYRTPWSGITKATLEGVTTTLEDVQGYVHSL